MAKKKPENKKESKPEKKAKVHPELEGFEIKINPLGDITSNFNIDQLNDFLDRNVRDKKLVGEQGKKRPQDEEEEFPIEETADVEENEEDFFKGSAKLSEEDEADLGKELKDPPAADDKKPKKK
jgi:hypothetical protein